MASAPPGAPTTKAVLTEEILRLRPNDLTRADLEGLGVDEARALLEDIRNQSDPESGDPGEDASVGGRFGLGIEAAEERRNLDLPDTPPGEVLRTAAGAVAEPGRELATDPVGTSKDIGRQTARSVTDFGTDVGAGVLRLADLGVGPALEAAGAPEPEALEQSAEFLQRRSRQTGETLGDPETAAGATAGILSRLGLEGLALAAGGQAVGFPKGAGTLRRVGQGLKAFGPLDAVMGASGEGGATAVAEMAGQEGVARALREHPVLGAAAEVGLGGTADVLIEGARGLRGVDEAADVLEGAAREGEEAAEAGAREVEKVPESDGSRVFGPEPIREANTADEVVDNFEPEHIERIERMPDHPAPPNFNRGEAVDVIQRAGLSSVAGGTIGSFFGESPEEKFRNGLIGATIGAAGGAGSRMAQTALTSARTADDEVARRMLEDVLADEVGEQAARAQSRSQLFHEAYRQALDDLHPLRRFRETVERETGEAIEPLDDPELLARLARGYEAHASQTLKMGVHKPGTTDFRSPGLMEVLDRVAGSFDDLRAYGLARRAIELADRDITTPIDLDQARAILRNYEGRDDLRQAFEDIQEIGRRQMELLEEEGVLQPGGAERVLEGNQNYFPLKREMPDEDAARGTGESFADLPDPVQRIVGSERLDVRDPLQELIRQQFTFSNLIHRQRVSSSLAKLARRVPDNEFMTRAEPGDLVERVEFNKEQLRDQMPDHMVDAVDDETIGAWVPRDIDHEEPLVRIQTEEGESEFYRLSPEMAEAVQGLGGRDHGMFRKFIQYASAPARWLRSGVTVMPDFQIANMGRDIPISAFTSKTKGGGGRALARATSDAMNGLALLVSDALKAEGEEIVQLWRSTGAPFAAFQQMDVDEMGRHLRALDRNDEPLWNVMHPLQAMRTMGNRLRGLTIAVENAPRMGEFQRAVRQEGRDPNSVLWAGKESKDITVDFSRHGASTDAIRPLAGFWNARMQGMDKIRRAILDNPKRALGAAFVGITAPSLGLYAVNRDDPAYWELPLWERNMYWNIPLPGNPESVPSFLRSDEESGGAEQLASPVVQREDKYWLRIPKPHELGWLFGSVPERLVEAIDPANPYLDEGVAETVEGFGGDLTQMLWEFVPAPTAALPIVENIWNYDTFLGRPVVPYYQAREETAEQLKGRERSSVIAKNMSDVLGEGGVDVAPPQIDNVIMGYFGSAGRAGSDLVDRLARDPEKGPAPEARASDRVFLGRFLRGHRDYSSRAVGEFYDRYEEAQGRRSTIVTWLSKGELDRAADAFREKPGALLKRDILQDISQKLSVYRDFRNKIRDAKEIQGRELTGEMKRQAMERIASAIGFYTALATYKPERRKELLQNNPQFARLDFVQRWNERLGNAERATRNARRMLEENPGVARTAVQRMYADAAKEGGIIEEE